MIHNLNINDFLSQYWQKRPLLIRNAFPGYHSPVTAEELAGLSCEDFVESRLVSEHKSEPLWRIEHGPFAEERFSKLPESHWTLLIQGLNKLFPELDDLLHEFNFIPGWRVDDLMASYAVTGGSVGPHIDQYDVFLLQASGRRKWMINQQPVTDADLLPGLPLKIIKNFKTESEWVLEPGDMLYLPPNVAHYGVALDDCMTFSIGFRAPSHAELISAYVDETLATLKDELRYQDADLAFNPDSGEITPQALLKVRQIIQSHFTNEEKMNDWFGRFITEYLNDEDYFAENNLTSAEFVAMFKKCKALRRPATVRANYIKTAPAELKLYINGMPYPLQKGSENIAQLFCNHHLLFYDKLKPDLQDPTISHFLTELYNHGYLEFLENEAFTDEYDHDKGS